MDIIPFQRMSEKARLPVRAEEANDRYGNAGFDLFLPLSNHNLIRLNPGEVIKLGLQIRSQIPKHLVGIVFDRGSTGFKGIVRLAGVFDSNYRGEWIIGLMNTTNDVIDYPRDKAIAQVVFLDLPDVRIEEVDNLDFTSRGEGMEGSTGH